jgi:hypothetical protein
MKVFRSVKRTPRAIMIRSYRSYLKLAPSWGEIDFSIEYYPHTRLQPPRQLSFNTPLPEGRKLRVTKGHFVGEVTLLSELLNMPYFTASELTSFFYDYPASCATLASAMLTWNTDNLVPLVVSNPEVSLQSEKQVYHYDKLKHPLLTGDQLDFFVRVPQVIGERLADELWSVSLDLRTLTGRCDEILTALGGSAIRRD